MYYPNNNPFSNISIFITLLASNKLAQDYSSIAKLNEIEWNLLFEEYFIPEYLHQVDKDTYIYELIIDYNDKKEYYVNIINNLKFPLIQREYQDLKNRNEQYELTEETLYDWRYPNQNKRSCRFCNSSNRSPN